MVVPKHLVAVVDFGSQYTQLIVRRVRELGYMAKLYTPEEIGEMVDPGAVILSGGPRSTSEPDAPALLTAGFFGRYSENPGPVHFPCVRPPQR